uniref:Ternary complex factor MIP1 leucine-zipper domain-containing protein n=1 Tax=Kalanchoe fedtschenkoi TaxID=63787 RepID=A0A7N0UM35_KALFE
MKPRFRTSLKPMTMTTPPPPKPPAGHHDKKNKMEMPGSGRSQPAKTAVNRSRERRMALLEDVDKLKRKLRHEENVHRALERAFTRPLGVLPRLPPYLPPQTLELLAEVAVLEEEVVRLEEQVVMFRQEVARRNTETSSDSSNDHTSTRNAKSDIQHSPNQSHVNSAITCSMLQPALARATSIKKLLDSDRPSDTPYRLPVKQNSKKTKFSSTTSADRLGKENRSMTNPKDVCSSNAKQPKIPTNQQSTEEESIRQVECRLTNHEGAQHSSSASDEKTLPFESTANKTSEEVLSCLLAIFMRMNTSKQKSSDPKACCPQRSSGVIRVDQYNVSDGSLQTSVGPYAHLRAIDSGSFDISKSTNAKFLIQRLKILLGKLGTVDIEGLSHQQKLAFWINVYNSCMMNAIIEHGVPESADMVAELMQKATINVGGHRLNAIAIEHFILRRPYHLKYSCPKVAKSDEMKRYSAVALEWPEPLVTFAISCGSRSSPAVRVYTATGVESELETAKRDYLRATVVISENKLMIPKLLTWYLLDFAKNLESLVDWICLQLPDDLRMAAIDCLKTRHQEPISDYIQIIPHDFNFCFLLHR